MRSEPAHLGGISLDFVGIPPRWDEHFPYEQVQVGMPNNVGYFCFTFEMLIKSKNIWSAK